jgi:outer membrane lipoprotein LolB
VHLPTSRNLAATGGLAVLLLFSACATQKSARLPEFASWEARQRILGELTHWGVTGRIAVSDGAEGFNGNLRWTQEKQGFQAQVNGPFGAGSVRIKGDGQRLTVIEKDGTVTELADAERELRAKYGWSIPLSSLRFWALGIPDPGQVSHLDFGDDGQLQRIAQDGWNVIIGQYRDGGGQSMPRRIVLENVDTRVRLVIDRWIFH